MKKIEFAKMVASGNDFVVVENIAGRRYPLLARKICDRKYGLGADGLLVLEKSRRADVRMRIFNSDGSEAEMCGNGARCVALWAKSKVNPSTTLRIDGEQSRTIKSQKSKLLKIETRAGIIDAGVNRDNVRIKLTEPKDIKLDIPIKVSNRTIRVNFINIGVPHTVIFVEGLDKINVVDLGRQLRYHKQFFPAGTNVDFVEVLNNDTIKVRTYERGVEDETLACGTGAVASSLITGHSGYPRISVGRATGHRKINVCTKEESRRRAGLNLPYAELLQINVYTKGGEVLKVYFDRQDNRFKNVWLDGQVSIVCKGEYYV